LGVSGLEQLVCFRDLLVWKHCASDGPERPGFDRGGWWSNKLRSLFEQDPVHGDIPVERKVEVALQLNDCRGTSARANRGEALARSL
jgi:hypothetical protein